jgi:membrane glycosyltransferase
MLWSILIGLGVVALVVFAVYEWKNRKPSTAAPAVASTVAATLAPTFAQLSEDFSTALAGIPALISKEVASLKAQLDATLQRAEAAEADAAQAKAAHAADLATVAGRVTAAITGSSELPAPAPPAAPEPVAEVAPVV